MTGANDQLRDIFRAAGRRLTSQRRLVLGVLRESDGHLDADMIYNRAKAHDPCISLATVYRTLSLLKEMNLIEEHRLGEEHSHYEAIRDEPHYHFTCRECGQVIEFDTPLVEKISQKVSEQEGVQITDAHLHLIGYCARCYEQLGGQNDNEK